MYRKYYLYKGYIDLASPSDTIVLTHLRKDVIEEFYNNNLSQDLAESLLTDIYNKNNKEQNINASN